MKRLVSEIFVGIPRTKLKIKIKKRHGTKYLRYLITRCILQGIFIKILW